MALTAFPLQSNFVGLDEYQNPIWDRAVDSRFYRNFWLKYFSDGIFAEPDDNFKVSPLSGLKVSVKLGECHIRGITALPDTNPTEILTLDPPTKTRIDRVVIRADFDDKRSVTVAVISDWQPSSTLKRNSNVWELAIADITLANGQATIQASNIADLRLNSDLCGIVTEPIRRANTTSFFNQITSEFSKVQSEWNSQKNSQQTNWQAQLNEQQNNYNALALDVNTWYSSIKQDITRMQTFDFDNLSSFDQVSRTTVRNGNTITETLRNAYSGIRIADRVTVKTLVSGLTNVKETTNIYNSTGVSPVRSATVTTQVNADKSITETVTGFNDFSLQSVFFNNAQGVVVSGEAPETGQVLWMNME